MTFEVRTYKAKLSGCLSGTEDVEDKNPFEDSPRIDAPIRAGDTFVVGQRLDDSIEYFCATARNQMNHDGPNNQDVQMYIDETFKSILASRESARIEKNNSSTGAIIDGDGDPIQQCRVCLEMDKIKNMISPCKCSGSSKYIHLACLKKWIREAHSLQSEYDLAECEVCKQKYIQKLIYRTTYTFAGAFQSKRFLVLLVLWVILLLICIAATIAVILTSEDKNSGEAIVYGFCIFGGLVIWSVIFYFCIRPKMKFRVLIDWNVLNYITHPKEKHPLAIRKFVDESLLDRSTQNNKYAHLQSIMMTQNKVSAEIPTVERDQSLVAVPPESIINQQQAQNISFFTKLGASQKILSDFLSSQASSPEKSLSFIAQKQVHPNNNTEAFNNRSAEQSHRSSQLLSTSQMLPNQERSKPPSRNNKLTTASERLQQNDHYSKIHLTVPIEQRFVAERFSQSTNLELAQQDESSRVIRKVQRHQFFAKDESYSIIVEPAEQLQQKPKTNTLVKGLTKIANEEKHKISDTFLPRVDIIAEMQEEEQERKLENSKIKEIIRACDTIESNRSVSPQNNNQPYKIKDHNTHSKSNEGEQKSQNIQSSGQAQIFNDLIKRKLFEESDRNSHDDEQQQNVQINQQKQDVIIQSPPIGDIDELLEKLKKKKEERILASKLLEQNKNLNAQFNNQNEQMFSSGIVIFSQEDPQHLGNIFNDTNSEHL